MDYRDSVSRYPRDYYLATPIGQAAFDLAFDNPRRGDSQKLYRLVHIDAVSPMDAQLAHRNECRNVDRRRAGFDGRIRDFQIPIRWEKNGAPIVADHADVPGDDAPSADVYYARETAFG